MLKKIGRLIFDYGNVKKEERYERGKSLPDVPCDMCMGTGTMETYDPPVMMTSSYDPGAYERLDKDVEEGRIQIVTVPCNTCNGTKILPKYLMPNYWK